MLGRPAICEPVFMNMWAGSWLIASVVIELIRQMSPSTEPMWGKSSQMWVPLGPIGLNGCCGPKQMSFCPCSCASCCPFVMLSGIGWPSSSASFGLWSNVSRCDGPPAIVSQITRFAFCGSGRLGSTPRCGAASSDRGAASAASATPPTPWAVLPRNARRASELCSWMFMVTTL